MRQIKSLTLMFAAILVLAGLAATTASATELRFLPEGSEANPVKAKVKSGEGKLATEGNPFEIKCKSDTGSSTFIGKRRGSFDVLFEKCTTAGGIVACTGLVDKTSGSILVKGFFDLRRPAGSPGSGARIAYLPTETHFNCGSSVLILVKGCAVGTITPLNSKTKTGESVIKQKEGKDEETTIENEAETGTEACALKAQENGGTVVNAGEETHETLETFTQGGTAVEVETMA